MRHDGAVFKLAIDRVTDHRKDQAAFRVSLEETGGTMSADGVTHPQELAQEPGDALARHDNGPVAKAFNPAQFPLVFDLSPLLLSFGQFRDSLRPGRTRLFHKLHSKQKPDKI
jgi:hypothetical protein